MSYESKLQEARAIIEGYERPSELNEINLDAEGLYNPVQERKSVEASKPSVKDFAMLLASM